MAAAIFWSNGAHIHVTSPASFLYVLGGFWTTSKLFDNRASLRNLLAGLTKKARTFRNVWCREAKCCREFWPICCER
eukprot:5153924-Amphidinium_carterae.1